MKILSIIALITGCLMLVGSSCVCDDAIPATISIKGSLGRDVPLVLPVSFGVLAVGLSLAARRADVRLKRAIEQHALGRRMSIPEYVANSAFSDPDGIGKLRRQTNSLIAAAGVASVVSAVAGGLYVHKVQKGKESVLPLVNALEIGNVEHFKELMDPEKYPNRSFDLPAEGDTSPGQTIAHLAVQRGNAEALAIVLDSERASSDHILEQSDCTGRTLLMDACSRGSYGVIRELIFPREDAIEGAWVSAVDLDGRTALHFLAGADRTPKESAALDESSLVEVARLLVNSGCNPEYEGEREILSEGGTVSQVIKEEKPTVIARAHGLNHLAAELEKYDGGKGPLMYACAAGDVKEVETLLAMGGTAGWTDDAGNTALHYLAGFGRKAGVKPNQADLEIIARQLVDEGCDPSRKNRSSQTAAEVALGGGLDSVAAVIETYKATERVKKGERHTGYNPNSLGSIIPCLFVGIGEERVCDIAAESAAIEDANEHERQLLDKVFARGDVVAKDYQLMRNLRTKMQDPGWDGAVVVWKPVEATIKRATRLAKMLARKKSGAILGEDELKTFAMSEYLNGSRPVGREEPALTLSAALRVYVQALVAAVKPQKSAAWLSGLASRARGHHLPVLEGLLRAEAVRDSEMRDTREVKE